MKIKLLIFAPFLLITTINCNAHLIHEHSINKSMFGKLKDGRIVYMFTLKNKQGAEAKIINYGATLVSLTAPDRNGKYEDIVLGYDNIEGYENGNSFFGAIVGRYGNRIRKGKFTIDGKNYQVTLNDGENHLHGGKIGFFKVLWKANTVENKNGASLKLTYVSKDGEQGYPGTVTINVTYTLTDNNELKIEYQGSTDKTTILNPTHHSYFNLTGVFTNTILDHQLRIDADSYTPIDSEFITTGEIVKVDSTPFDFRIPKAIGAEINSDFEQLKFGKGYDHNFVLNNYSGKVRQVVEVYEPQSGRYLQVFTDQPGLQFYSGNFLNGKEIGKNNTPYQYRTGLCLETQYFPDSPNHKNFPSPILKPGQLYKQTTIYRFSAK